jgi:hypothetical protein
MKILGIVLIIIGIVMIVFREVRFTKTEEVADLGPIELNKKEQKRVAWPTYAGITVSLVGAIVLVAAGKKRVA